MFILKVTEPSSIPYRTHAPCAKRAAYPDPPPVIPVPESIAAQGEVYKGTRFFNGDRALVVKRWLHRLDEDASGLTFEEWNPAQAVGTSQEPAPMIINSSQLRAAGFKLDKVIPPQLEAAARSGMRTRGSGLRQLRGMGSESGQKGNFPEFSVR